MTVDRSLGQMPQFLAGCSVGWWARASLMEVVAQRYGLAVVWLVLAVVFSVVAWRWRCWWARRPS